MSDGISEGYRASWAAKNFDKAWEEAQIEQILLDAKSLFNEMSIGDLITHLMELCPTVRLKNYDQFAIPYKDVFLYSYTNYTDQPCPLVRFYEIEISGKGTHRSFKGQNFIEVLKEATLFAEWIETDEGRRAVKEYNDY